MTHPLLQFALFAVYGNYSQEYIDAVLADPLPEGIRLEINSKEENPEKLELFIKGPPYSDEFPVDNPETYQQLSTSNHCFYLFGNWEEPTDPLSNYTSMLSLLHFFALEKNTVAIAVPLLVKLFSKDQWLAQIGEPVLQGDLAITQHFLVDVVAQENKGFWMKTRGMLQFGKPDLSLHDVPENLIDPWHSIINKIASVMIFNNYLPANNQEVALYNEPTGIKASYGGSYEDDDFWGNVHLELLPL